jgi:hypothetical protein
MRDYNLLRLTPYGSDVFVDGKSHVCPVPRPAFRQGRSA